MYYFNWASPWPSQSYRLSRLSTLASLSVPRAYSSGGNASWLQSSIDVWRGGLASRRDLLMDGMHFPYYIRHNEKHE
ncbi:hypothetical protein BC937DRAFT_90662 [Endogone sp. FLAS-F59071]|nr:hypothetical protein BC937DRAFT_90662 [Endogone sp. FLAS-F59071]|eukprot:RUS16906.1 hypothetical protein BC937DRAFT_90662 [Endogone sp. FLAS-F59071]